MKKMITAVFVLLCFLRGTTQLMVQREETAADSTYRFSYNKAFGPIKDVVLGSSSETSKGIAPGTKKPGLKTFIEFGDGYFSTSPDDLNISTRLYTRAGIDTAYDPIASLYIIYTPKPPSFLATVDQSETAILASPNNGVQKHLDSLGKRIIAVIPSIGNVIPNDIMTFAIPYKIPRSSRTQFIEKSKAAPRSPASDYIIFLYNEAAPGADIFEKIPGQGTNYKYPNRPDIKDFPNTDVAIKPVRGLPKGLSVVNESPVSEETDAQVKLFNNHLFIRLDDSNFQNDYLEHNIFISLLTSGNTNKFIPISAPNASETKVRVLYVSNGVIIDSAEISLAGDLKSHDPNNISCYPACLKPDTAHPFTKFNFTLRFENDGEGPAQKIMVQPLLDSNKALHLRHMSNIILTLQNNQHLLVTRDAQCRKKDFFDAAQPGIFIINFGDSVSYSIQLAAPLLKGVGFPGLAEKQGSVTFTLDGNTPDSAADVNCYAGIFFDNNGIYKTKEPFKIKVSNDCDKQQATHSCWPYWWIIIILLLALIIAIFLLRRRRH